MHLILPDVGFDLEGEMHRKQKKNINNNKQAKNKQTKTKQ